MERQVPSFQVAQKTAEISQVQFIDRVVRFFCRATDSVPTVQTVQKIVQITQMQFLEKGMTIPVVVQHQVSMVQVVQKTAWKKSTGGQLQDELQGECKQLQLSADSSRKQITMCS